jgi:hypothetical protein
VAEARLTARDRPRSAAPARQSDLAADLRQAVRGEVRFDAQAVLRPRMRHSVSREFAAAALIGIGATLGLLAARRLWWKP